jgi:hypothetical protein
MPFADDFSTCMSGAGITVDANIIPDADTFASVIEYVRNYHRSLDSDIAAALDAATASDDAATILADPEVNAIDPSYIPLLQAFDAASGMPLSTCLDWCEYCIGQARESSSSSSSSGSGA